MFTRSTATVAAWNLAGFGGITKTRQREQVKGLALMDAEVVTLVEVPSRKVMEFMRDELKKVGLKYDITFKAQNNDLHIGILSKKGVGISNVAFIPGSDLGDPGKRQALASPER